MEDAGEEDERDGAKEHDGVGKHAEIVVAPGSLDYLWV